jgi:hypothetical protein
MRSCDTLQAVLSRWSPPSSASLPLGYTNQSGSEFCRRLMDGPSFAESRILPLKLKNTFPPACGTQESQTVAAVPCVDARITIL